MKIAKQMRRSRSRGAAMIEGVIVVSTMVVFLGLITFSRQSYGMKLDLQQTTRANVLYYASHACTGDANGASTEAGTGSGGDSQVSAAGKEANIGGSGAAASKSYNDTSAKTTGSVDFSAVWDSNANGGGGAINLQKHTGSRSISAASKCSCNEPKYNTGGFSEFISWMKFGFNFITSGGGLINLIK